MAAMLDCLSRILVDRRSSTPPPGWAGMAKVLHRFTFEQYSVCKSIGHGEKINSDAFAAGGHQWVVAVIPEAVPGNDQNALEEAYLALFIGLVNSEKAVSFFCQMTLLDQSGKGNHLTRYYPSSPEPRVIKPNEYAGYRYFIGRNRLEKSNYLKDDCLKIECRISVVSSATTHGPQLITPWKLNSIDRSGFLCLLDTGYGSDAVFSVRGGEKFRVHKGILSARSSVFRSMFAAVSDETFVIDMEPRVFKALLHYIYSDTLPEEVMSGFAFGPSVSSTLAAKLLEAAVDYDLTHLKSICEAHIWRSTSLGRVAETLLLAERCNASALKSLCLKYAADNYAYLVQLDSLKCLGENCPLLLKEVEDYYNKTGMKKGDFSSSIERLSEDVNDCLCVNDC